MFVTSDKLSFIRKTAFWRSFLFIALVITTLPLLAIAPFNHSSGDDFSYGYRVHDAITQSGDPIEIVKAIAETVTVTYQNWQGSYSAVVLFSIQPAVWGEQFYWISPFVMIGFLLWGVFSLFRSWIGVGFGRKDIADIASCGVSILFLQLLPSPVEGLYWWNGASYYIIWNALMMVFLSQLTLVLHKRKCSMFKCALLALFGGLICGGNFVTALLTLEIVILILAYAIFTRNNWKQILIVFLFVFAGFLANVLAPGNANRQEAYEQLSPALAVVKSFYAALIWALRWTSPMLIGFLMLLVPFAFMLQSKTNLRPSLLPLWCKLLILICLFASSFTPNIFAGTSINIGRIQNIRFLIWIITCVSAEICIIQAISMRMVQKNPEFQQKNALTWITTKKAPLIVGLGLLVICASAMQSIKQNGYDAFACVSAAHSVLSGEAQSYDRTADERVEQLLSNEKNIVLKPFTMLPYVIYKGDITTNASNWRNRAVARFYGKESVVLGQDALSEK